MVLHDKSRSASRPFPTLFWEPFLLLFCQPSLSILVRGSAPRHMLTTVIFLQWRAPTPCWGQHPHMYSFIYLLTGLVPAPLLGPVLMAFPQSHIAWPLVPCYSHFLSKFGSLVGSWHISWKWLLKFAAIYLFWWFWHFVLMIVCHQTVSALAVIYSVHHSFLLLNTVPFTQLRSCYT